ncbi:MAG: STAS domain-containing protein [Jatrophihabitans sp.]
MTAAPIPPASEVAVRIDETGELQVTTVVVDATRATLQLRGEMDLSNADLLTAVLANQLSFGRHFIRLDVSRLGFLDCAGLRAIVLAHNDCLSARGVLVLAGATRSVTRLLAITHLDEALRVENETDRTPQRSQRLAAVAP